MPCIKCNLNVKVSNKITENIKTKLGKSIELILRKNESWLMVIFNDDLKMYFRGSKDELVAFIEVKLFVKNDMSNAYPKLISEITKIFCEELDIKPTNVFVKIDETYNWGYDGKML